MANSPEATMTRSGSPILGEDAENQKSHEASTKDNLTEVNDDSQEGPSAPTAKAIKRVTPITLQPIDAEDVPRSFTIDSHIVNKEDSTVKFILNIPSAEARVIAEEKLQRVKAQKVLQYWKTKGGRDAATGLDLYRVMNILEHKTSCVGRGRSQRMYRCQFEGYSKSKQDTTWETEAYVLDVADDVLIPYALKHGIQLDI